MKSFRLTVLASLALMLSLPQHTRAQNSIKPTFIICQATYTTCSGITYTVTWECDAGSDGGAACSGTPQWDDQHTCLVGFHPTCTYYA